MPPVRRALFVTTVPDTLRAFLKPFSAFFRERGWQVDAAASEVDHCGDLQDSFDRLFSVPFSRKIASWKNISQGGRAIRRVIRGGNYDVVHVHSPIASLLTRAAVRRDRGRSRMIMAYTAHGFHFFSGNSALKNLLFFHLERLAARWTDYLFTINSEDHAASLRFGTIPRDRIILTSGIGVDISKYGKSDGPQSWPTGLPFGPGSKYILNVAEFTARKRPWDVISALGRIQDASLHLVMAGEGPLLDSMKQLAQRLGLNHRVHFLGFRSDIPSLLRHAEMLTLPSAQEGLPRCIMEAFCAEIPVVASDIRGSRDLLEGGAGLAFPVGQPEKLAAAASQLLADRALRTRITAAARSKLQKYSFEAVIPAYEEVYFHGSPRQGASSC